jgi:L-lactate dehydrogenase
MEEYSAKTGKCTPKDLDEMHNQVKHAAYEIIEKKGATYYAIALAVARITACIAGEENSVLTVSSVFDGEYGIKDVALSVPTQVSGYGVEQIFEVPLNQKETDGLYKSAHTLRENLRELQKY